MDTFEASNVGQIGVQISTPLTYWVDGLDFPLALVHIRRVVESTTDIT